jgi:hypothetical protein
MQRTLTYLKEMLAVGIACMVFLITLNNALFLHYHASSDGSLVSHAHPFSPSGEENSPIQGHRHTGLEMILLDSLMTLALATSFFYCILAVLTRKQVGGSIQSIPLQSVIPAFQNKAPPLI